jgi:23S rRNA (cytosine1962-C5)-methyltransferase
MSTLPQLVESAIAARAQLCATLAGEGTDSYRLFHGAAEGREGLAIDRYGTLVLVQMFREPLSDAERAELEPLLRARVPEAMEIAFVERGARERADSESADHLCREFGASFLVRARHRGVDPWLFLDLRAGRRALRALCAGRSVLNLFAYTCSAGISAAVAGASEVWNVDFARSALEIGRRNAEQNGIDPARMRFVQEDCLPVLRQLAGLPVKGRGAQRDYLRLEARRFDVVFLDPPAWATGPFGAVDVEHDYPALLKPALLATSPGGSVVATNHAASVDREEWLAILRRCAEKAGRPLAAVESIAPEADFPSRDGHPPLKIAVCSTAP